MVSVSGIEDPDETIVVEAGITAQGAEHLGDDLYLTPFILMGIDENPFKLEQRTFPVDYSHAFTRTYTAQITLPDGYVPEELPDPVQLTIPGQGATYLRVYSFDNGALLVRARLQGNQVVFEPDLYPALRQLYDEIVAAETEAVVLVPGAEPGNAVMSEAAIEEH